MLTILPIKKKIMLIILISMNKERQSRSNEVGQVAVKAQFKLHLYKKNERYAKIGGNRPYLFSYV